MKIKLLLTLCMLLLVCSGCRRPPASSTHDTSRYKLAGQWSFGSGSSGPDILAGLVNKATGVSGKATVYGCGERPEETELAGTVSREGNLTLQTELMQNGVMLSLQGKLSSDGMTFVGFLRSSLFAHCGSLRSAQIRGRREPLAYGDYAGDLSSSSDGSKLRAIVSVQQHTPFGPGGRYPVSSSISLPDPPCTGNFWLQAQRSTMSGGVLTAVYTGSGGQGQPVVTLKAVLGQSGGILQVLDIGVTGGSCREFHGAGRLTLD